MIKLSIEYLPDVENLKITKFFFGKKWITNHCYLGCHYEFKGGTGICRLCWLPDGIDVSGVGPNNCNYKFKKIDLYNKEVFIELKRGEELKKSRATK